jgi:hypothetical protein
VEEVNILTTAAETAPEESNDHHGRTRVFTRHGEIRGALIRPGAVVRPVRWGAGAPPQIFTLSRQVCRGSYPSASPARRTLSSVS